MRGFYITVTWESSNQIKSFYSSKHFWYRLQTALWIQQKEQPLSKVYRVQGNPSRDTRKDGVDHMPKWSENRQRCLKCKTGFSLVSCKKCSIWLCLNKDRNCFEQYHIWRTAENIHVLWQFFGWFNKDIVVFFMYMYKPYFLHDPCFDIRIVFYML